MPTGVIAETVWPRLRLCTVRKSREGEEYGFNLHAERSKGQYIGDVDVDSPAYRGGLRTGDRIIGVNGHTVVSESHKEVGIVHVYMNYLNICRLCHASKQ